MSVDPYAWYAIKNYRYWRMYMHPNQYPYLGRCYASSHRIEAQSVTDMTLEEMIEFYQVILPQWRSVITSSWGEFLPNVAFFSNTWPHLHVHMIPRFEINPVHYGVHFEDRNRGRNYAPYISLELSIPLMADIKIRLMQAFNTSSQSY